MRHANTYRAMDEFKGKRVLIIGAGNSGCDIACDAAQSADKAFISLRRGYHFIPKHIFGIRSEEHTSELQSLMRISYAVFCLKKKNKNNQYQIISIHNIV